MEAQGTRTVQPVVENRDLDPVRPAPPVATPVVAARAGPTIANLERPVTALVPTARAGTSTAILAAPMTAAAAPLMVALDAAPTVAPVVAPIAAPVMAPPALAPALGPAVIPVVGQVMALLAGQFIANFAVVPNQPPPGGFDLDAALGGSDPPQKTDMRYKLWPKL
ncbi:hypothetical protein M758_12G107000 [Ceratodon purpureus]|nr:hypothetical protein M758_12G107000 [Ceratodon purpureus]